MKRAQTVVTYQSNIKCKKESVKCCILLKGSLWNELINYPTEFLLGSRTLSQEYSGATRLFQPGPFRSGHDGKSWGISVFHP